MDVIKLKLHLPYFESLWNELEREYFPLSFRFYAVESHTENHLIAFRNSLAMWEAVMKILCWFHFASIVDISENLVQSP